jgi:hypothetical protein
LVNTKKKRFWAVQGLNFFSDLPNLLPQKIRLPLISFFSGVSYIWGSYIGKLHRERAVTGRIFQALLTQTDTTTVAFLGVTENDLL